VSVYDVVVVGCGGIGSATLYWLSRLGAGQVLGLEQFRLGSERGASSDHSRMIRKAYAQRHYTALIAAAYDAWHEVEGESGLQLITRTGALDLAPAGTPGAERLDGCIDAMRYARIDCTELEAADVTARWPQFRLPQGTRGVYQADGGIVAAARANAVHVALARARGAQVREQVVVEHIRPLGDHVDVVTDAGTFSAGRVVLTSGAWTSDHLAGLGLSWPLSVTQEQVTYFATPHLRQFRPEVFPAWSWFGEQILYGFPVYGEVAVKAAQDLGGARVTAATRTFEPDPSKVPMLSAFLREHIPAALGPELYTKTCLYTLPPDRDFVVGPLADFPQVLVAVGAGHAFKFAGLIGKILSQRAVGGRTDYDIDAFRTDRPALTDGAGEA